MRVVVLVALTAGCATAPHPSDSHGSVFGLARDRDSGVPIENASIELRPHGKRAPMTTTSNVRGYYAFDHLTPGSYDLIGTFAGQPVQVVNIAVPAGDWTLVDVVFTLGRPEPMRNDFSEPAPIERYHPPRMASSVSLIEGTVTDLSSRVAIPGTVVTAVGAGDYTLQTVTDEHGRYHFEQVIPGTYAVSAYYSIGGRGQIEVRRSQIAVAGAEAVIVPLTIELAR